MIPGAFHPGGGGCSPYGPVPPLLPGGGGAPEYDESMTQVSI